MKFVVGIDLGTTNSVLAFAEIGHESQPDVQLMAIPQLTGPGVVESLPSLPSFMVLMGPHESSEQYRLPFDSASNSRDFVAGTYARSQSADSPDRVVSAAKSWLGHHASDRHAKLLPWEAPDDVKKVSPVTATQRYLEHLVSAWNHAHPEAPLSEQEVVLTVPASFDASARELTREAAVGAGLPNNFVLLEEPQAAVYAWLADQGDSWREHLTVGDRLLICDIGGGTTDLTLIEATDHEGTLQLERVAVGKHLLVGGDNMDLAVAHLAAERFQSQGVALDPWQSVALWHSCRDAKESLLSGFGPDRQPVSVLGRGRKLIGGTVSTDLNRDEVTRLLIDGFFPDCELTDRPSKQRQSGFVQLGLPFETDTAITRHVAGFMNSQPQEAAAKTVSYVLFNGGVFSSSSVRQRMLDVMAGWYPESPPSELAGNRDLESSVARGAAYYGWNKHRGGVRIRGGTARSYYIGIESSGLAIPGAPRPLKALCVVPFGMEEGTQIDVPGSETGLVLGESVQFRFFSSINRHDDPPGKLLDRVDPDELQETDSLEADLARSELNHTGAASDEFVPVTLQSRVTELGVFELWCVSVESDERWKLEFSVRDNPR